jgi:Phosphotransferase enzyme family
MPEPRATIDDLKIDPMGHPAVKAWRQLELECAEPKGVDLLKDNKRDGAVYRLAGVGPGGTNVVAKRCDLETAAIERLVYQEILPQLPISALQCYGSILDDDRGYCWLFLEDAGDGAYSSDLEAHRRLGGHWLGAMNASAQRLPIATRLPDRGPNHYLQLLQQERNTTRQRLDHPTFDSDERRPLQAIVSHADVLEQNWGRIERFCARMPRTLVHGDLSQWNAHPRVGPAGENLAVLDWEFAGWGIPAVDLTQFAANALTPDLATYWQEVQECWPHLDLGDIQRLAHVGSIFRWIDSVAWANSGRFDRRVARWYLADMEYYEPGLEEWTQGLESLLELP